MDAVDIISRLDLSQLLYSPFQAAAQAQAKLANTTVDFIKTFAFEPGTDEVRTVTLSSFYDMDISANGGKLVDDPYNPGKKVRQGKKTLTIPFLTLLNVPALQMQKVVVDLTVKVESQSIVRNEAASTSATQSSTNAAFAYNAFFSSGSFSSSVNTQVSASNNSSSSIDSSSSAKYDIHMEAINQPPIGLSIILDFLTSSSNIAPNRGTYKDTIPMYTLANAMR